MQFQLQKEKEMKEKAEKEEQMKKMKIKEEYERQKQKEEEEKQRRAEKIYLENDKNQILEPQKVQNQLEKRSESPNRATTTTTVSLITALFPNSASEVRQGKSKVIQYFIKTP